MAFNEKARIYAFETIEQRRLVSDMRLREYRIKLFRQFPKLQEFEREISSLGITLAKAALSNGSDTKAIKSEIKDREKKRGIYLKEQGLDDNISFYTCASCKDTGYVNSKLCDCAVRLMRDYSIVEMNKISPLELSSFAEFSLSYYPTAVISGENGNISPRKSMKKVYDSCVAFAKNFPKYENLLLMGDAGLGKTHLALSIANEIIKRGYNVIYCSAANIFKVIEEEYFQEFRTSQTLETLKTCDLLVVDDLGAEYVNAFIGSTVYDIINTRIISRLPTVYTTNIVRENILEARYGEKVSSRLTGCCKLLYFFGDDIRILKKNNPIYE